MFAPLMLVLVVLTVVGVFPDGSKFEAEAAEKQGGKQKNRGAIPEGGRRPCFAALARSR